MSEPTCPDEADLLAMATGESPPAAVADHLKDCATCRERLKQLQGEITSLRKAVSGGRSSILTPPAAPVREAGGPGEAGAEAPAGSLSTILRAGRRPAHVGKYFVAGLLDDGETTLVYRALHPTVNKELVIKLGRQAAADDPARNKALLEEGKQLAQLEHPHLVRVFDLNFQERRPFLVLEYVGGSGLKQYAEEARPTPVQAAALVAKLARGLAEVHRAGLVHGEINPGNVRVADAGQPRLEFGLATLHQRWTGDEGQPADSILTYMAPEQARGEREHLGPRSDLFGLGSILYFLLTGKAPFAGKDAFESLERLRRVDYDREALRAPAIPRRLQAICARALDPDPAARYASAEELADALERFVRHPHGYRAWLIVAAALVLAGVVGGILYLLLGGSE
jgi:tRNA A-37 threonylcarbamoyl transferase component Bud32